MFDKNGNFIKKRFVFKREKKVSPSDEKKKQKLLTAFEKIEAILKEHRIHYFAEGGTVLGCLRHRDLIPGDKDIDIGIDSKQIPDLLKLRPVFKEHKIVLMGYYGKNDDHPSVKVPTDNLDDDICQDYLKRIQNDDFCSSLEYGTKEHGFFLKLFCLENRNTVDVFPHSKQANQEKYCPTGYFATGYNIDFYFRDIYDITYCKFNRFIMPVCTDSINYACILYGKKCLIQDEYGNPI